MGGYTMIKYKWKVQSEPTGRYRSFDKRGWPEAVTPEGDTLAVLHCDDDYVPSLAKSGNHRPITIRIRIASETGSWRWGKLKGEWPSLKEAKKAFKSFLVKYPNHDFAKTPSP